MNKKVQTVKVFDGKGDLSFTGRTKMPKRLAQFIESLGLKYEIDEKNDGRSIPVANKGTTALLQGIGSSLDAYRGFKSDVAAAFIMNREQFQAVAKKTLGRLLTPEELKTVAGRFTPVALSALSENIESLI